jgi:four helix bundle protein
MAAGLRPQATGLVIRTWIVWRHARPASCFKPNDVKDFKKLQIWQEGMDLADMVYAVIEDIPWQRGQKVIDQLSSSALSIPSNIAEGNSRRSEKDKYRFMEFALGSAFELETQLLFSQRRGWSTQEKLSTALHAATIEQKKIQKFMEALDP